jgi:ribosomal-protein-alanine N-acetyltransferase
VDRGTLMSFRVRLFEKGDAAAVARITAASPQAAQWSEQSYAELLECGCGGWVAGCDLGELVGFIVTRTIADEAEILNLAVAHAARRTGVGAELLESVLRSLEESNVRRVYLEVRASNAPALAFYRTHLFSITGTRPDYYQNPTESAVLMERILTGPTS